MNTIDTKPVDPKIKAKRQRKKSKPADGGFLKRLSTDPFTDWAIIVAAAFIASLCLVAVGVSVYLDTGARLAAPPTVNPAVSETSFSADKLSQIVSEFAGRAQTTESLIKGYTASHDPSLP